jgi:hypothetical protein
MYIKAAYFMKLTYARSLCVLAALPLNLNTSVKQLQFKRKIARDQDERLGAEEYTNRDYSSRLLLQLL